MAVNHEHIPRRPKTLDDIYHAAKTANLEPQWNTPRTEVLFACPQCKYDGIKATASAHHHKIAGAAIVHCQACNDEHDILQLLGELAPPWADNVIPLNGNGTNPGPTTLAWTPLDLVTLGDQPRIPPAIAGLFYPGRRHILTGESESGKTWAALAAAATELQQGYSVIWADLDFMGAQDILERLRQLDIPDHLTRDLFAFYQPDGPLEGHSLDAVIELTRANPTRLVVLDSFTGLCHVHGLKPNDGIDIENAYRKLQPLCDAGCAVTLLDHVVKSAENRGRYASGSERKLSGADVAIGFQLVEHYGRGRTGRSRLTVHKDRPAMLKRPTAGIFTLNSDPDTNKVTFKIDDDHTKGTDGSVRLTGFMERISIYLQAQIPDAATWRQIDSDLDGKAEHKRSALKTLVAEGYAHLEIEGRAHLYTHLKPYREADE